MDQLINALGSIPVLGLVVQFVGYVVENLQFVAHGAVGVAIPIALAGLCGVLCERSGVVNIGIEGIMLTAAFVGWVVGVAATGLLGPAGASPLPVFGITLSLLIALVVAVLSGMLLSLLHAWLAISVRVDQIISGTIINIAAFGLTGYLNTLISTLSPQGAGSFSPLTLPKEIVALPVIGWLINAVFGQGPIGIAAIVLIVVLQVLLVRSLGPPDARGRRAPQGGRDGRRRRHPAAVPERRRRGRRRGAGRCLPQHGDHELVPGRDDRRPGLHRSRGDDRRPLDPARRAGRRPAVRVVAGDQPVDHVLGPDRLAG
jgi:hypothetical protein